MQQRPQSSNSGSSSSTCRIAKFALDDLLAFANAFGNSLHQNAPSAIGDSADLIRNEVKV